MGNGSHLSRTIVKVNDFSKAGIQGELWIGDRCAKQQDPGLCKRSVSSLKTGLLSYSIDKMKRGKGRDSRSVMACR